MKLEYALDYSDFLEHQLYISSKSELHKKNRNRSRIIVPIIYIGLSLFLSFINEIALAIVFFWVCSNVFLFYPLYYKHKYKNTIFRI